MHPATLPIQLPVNDIVSSGIPILDEDFDPSEPLLPDTIDLYHDDMDYSYE